MHDTPKTITLHLILRQQPIGAVYLTDFLWIYKWVHSVSIWFRYLLFE